jgi:hypothetical protein
MKITMAMAMAKIDINENYNGKNQLQSKIR